MSDHNDSRSPERAPDLARIAVAQARQRMIAAAAQPIAVKWRSMRRGDRAGSMKPDASGQHRQERQERPPGSG